MNKSLYSSITYYGILLIAVVHLLGFLFLREWLDFSGIGAEAQRVESQYGYIGIVLLNASAMFTFFILAIIVRNKNNNIILSNISRFIVIVFIIRGLSGYIFSIMGMVGSATIFWEFIFSTLSLGIGIAGIIGQEVK